MSKCLDSADRYQEESKLDIGKTLLDTGIQCFDFGKVYFLLLGKTFLLWELILGNFDIWKMVSHLRKWSRTLRKRSRISGNQVSQLSEVYQGAVQGLIINDRICEECVVSHIYHARHSKVKKSVVLCEGGLLFSESTLFLYVRFRDCQVEAATLKIRHPGHIATTSDVGDHWYARDQLRCLFLLPIFVLFERTDKKELLDAKQSQIFELQKVQR